MSIDERENMNELRRGSVKAFSQIYEIYADRLYGFALKHLKNRTLAQDIVQDTFLRLWNNRDRFTYLNSFQSLLFTIAKHQIIDHFRRQVNELQFEEFVKHYGNSIEDVTPEDVMLYDEFLQQLESSKTVLSEREREIYELSREKYISIKHIATQLNLSEQTVKNHLTNALKKLRLELRKHNPVFILFL